MVLSTGALHAIAAARESLVLEVLASPANAPAIARDPAVAHVVVFDKKQPGGYAAAWRALRARRYDAVIDCMVTAPSLTTLILMLASGARHRVGVRGRGNDFAYTVLAAPAPRDAHIADQLGALAAPFAVSGSAVPHNFRPRVVLDDSELARAEEAWRDGGADSRGTRVLVNVSAGIAARRWPDDRYVAVLQTTRARLPHATLLVIGAPHERERTRAIAAAVGAAMPETPSVRDAFALVATANAMFTPDTSLAHAASAFGTPTVAMYLPGMARLWGRYASPGEDLTSPGGHLDSLSLETALAAWIRCLATLTPRR